MATDCSQAIDLICRDKTTALHLKIGAIAAIGTASCCGVLIPLVGKHLRFLRTDGNFFFVAKAFAAGVILATGFCHMLPDAEATLGNPCLNPHPWAKFPWDGFIAMMAALLTLVVDFVGTEYYERKHGVSAHGHAHGHGFDTMLPASGPGSRRINNEADLDTHEGDLHKLKGNGAVANGGGTEKVEDIENKCSEANDEIGHMGIIDMRAHAASHSHSHADGQHGVVGGGHHHSTGHHHVPKDSSQEEISIRHVVISQVLELGIVAHSVLIGLALGVSDSPCTIRPLIAALCFHQFFEGFALGGCISQAGFKRLSAGIMAFFFCVTTPTGICLGIAIASGYNENSAKALIIEGTFDAISAGILIYMALVDLIAADFLSKRLRCDRQLQVFSYLALFLGAGCMALLAYWA